LRKLDSQSRAKGITAADRISRYGVHLSLEVPLAAIYLCGTFLSRTVYCIETRPPLSYANQPDALYVDCFLQLLRQLGRGYID